MQRKTPCHHTQTTRPFYFKNYGSFRASAVCGGEENLYSFFYGKIPRWSPFKCSDWSIRNIANSVRPKYIKNAHPAPMTFRLKFNSCSIQWAWLMTRIRRSQFG